jgi:hypothetical protein
LIRGRSGQRRASEIPAFSGRACTARPRLPGRSGRFCPDDHMGGWCLRKYSCHFGYNGGLLP